MEVMETSIKKLKSNRPNLTTSSLKTYVSILYNLYKKMNGKGDAYQFFSKNVPLIIEHLKDDRPNLRKTKMAVLVSLFGDDVNTEKLRLIMLEDANQYNAMLRSQEASDKQRENWISVEEIKKVYKDLYKRVSPLFKKENEVKKREYGELLDLVLLSLYVLMTPRRSQDYAEMKIRNYDTEKDNYYDGRAFHFVKYKTSKVYGKQKLNADPRIRNMMKKWMLVNPHDYLLSSYDGNKISVSRMTLLLNKIFGKNVSTTMLRHIFISEQVLKDAPSLKQMEKVATDMGHSVEMQQQYRVLPSSLK